MRMIKQALPRQSLESTVLGFLSSHRRFLMTTSSKFSIISSHKLTRAHKLTGSHSASLNPQFPLISYISFTHIQTNIYFERKKRKTICALTYFLFKMYLGPALLSEFVSTYKQMVDIVGREAVGACILLIKPGQQQ